MFNRLQNQLLLTGDKEAKADKKGQGINGFFKRLFKGERWENLLNKNIYIIINDSDKKSNRKTGPLGGN